MTTAQYFKILCKKDQQQVTLYAPESVADKDSKIWSDVAELFLCYEIWKTKLTSEEEVLSLARAYDSLCALLRTDNRKESEIPNTGDSLCLSVERISRVTALKKELSVINQRVGAEEPEGCCVEKWTTFCEMLVIWDEHIKNTEDDALRQSVIDVFYRFWKAQIKCANSPHGIYND